MDTERLCLATGDSVVILARDGNGTWTSRSDLGGHAIQCLAADPLARHIVYAGSAKSGVFRSDDGGEQWQQLGYTEGPRQVFSLAVSPSWRTKDGGVVLAGIEPSALYVSETLGHEWRDLPALLSIPSAPRWSFPPRPWTSHVRSIALSPFVPGLILASIELGGVMRSTNYGETWEDHRPDAHRDGHALAIHPRVPGRAYEAAGDGGAAQSFDNGETWQQVDEGLTRRYGWALAVDGLDPSCWYISTSPGPYQAHYVAGHADSVIYRRRGDNPWQEVRGAGLPTPSKSLISALYADPDQPGHLYAGVRSGEVYFTPDYGDSWEMLPVRVPAIEAICGCG